MSKRIEIGESWSAPAGRHTVSVYRFGEDAYRVVVLGVDGLAIQCYTNVFEDVSRLPVGWTNRRGAWEYAKVMIRDFVEEAETPKQVAQRVHAHRAVS